MSVLDLVISNKNPVKEGDEIVLVNSDSGCMYHLTEGKTYIALYDLEPGIFYDRPFVTVISDNDKKFSCHASRFVHKTDSEFYYQQKNKR